MDKHNGHNRPIYKAKDRFPELVYDALRKSQIRNIFIITMLTFLRRTENQTGRTYPEDIVTISIIDFASVNIYIIFFQPWNVKLWRISIL